MRLTLTNTGADINTHQNTEQSVSSPTEKTSPIEYTKALIAEAKALIRANLAQAASDILAWQNTAILPDGVIKKAAEILQPVYPDPHQQIERMVVKASLELVAGVIVAAPSPSI